MMNTLTEILVKSSKATVEIVSQGNKGWTVKSGETDKKEQTLLNFCPVVLTLTGFTLCLVLERLTVISKVLVLFFTKVFVAHLLCNRLTSSQVFLLGNISCSEDGSRNHSHILLLPVVFWVINNTLMLCGYFSGHDWSIIGKLNTLIPLRNRRGPSSSWPLGIGTNYYVW